MNSGEYHGRGTGARGNSRDESRLNGLDSATGRHRLKARATNLGPHTFGNKNRTPDIYTNKEPFHPGKSYVLRIVAAQPGIALYSALRFSRRPVSRIILKLAAGEPASANHAGASGLRKAREIESPSRIMVT